MHSNSRRHSSNMLSKCVRRLWPFLVGLMILAEATAVKSIPSADSFADDDSASSSSSATKTIECDSISNYAGGRPYCIINRLHTRSDRQRIVYAPTLFAAAKREMLFDHCRMHRIPHGLFRAFPNLRTLFTWNAGLLQLRPADLQGAATLRNLDVSQNNISELVEATFFGAIDVEYVNLARNRIAVMPKLTFHGLVRLRILHLEHNRIEALPLGMFDAMPRLETLYADHNRIGRIAVELFRRNTPLHELHLHANAIREIEGQPFAHLRRLDRFRVDANPVENLDYLLVDAVYTDVRNVSARGCYIGRRTQQLLASENRIDYVLVADPAVGPANYTTPDTESEEPTLRIEHLDVHANRLRSFANLTGLRRLQRLDVSDNQLADLGVASFARMPDLVELRLRNSGLRAVGFGLVSHRERLRWLDVAHNQLGHVELNRFTGLPALRALFLEGNRLRRIDLSGLRQYFPALQRIGLAQNAWNCTNLAAAVKVLEASGVELNAVGLVRDRTNIKGIACEAAAAANGAGEVTTTPTTTTATTALTMEPTTPAELDASDRLSLIDDDGDFARTSSATAPPSTSTTWSSVGNSHINAANADAAAGSSSSSTPPAADRGGISARELQTLARPSDSSSGSDLFAQLVALEREATAAAAGSQRVAAGLQRLWLRLLDGEHRQRA